jgi:acyl carrier protein
MSRPEVFQIVQRCVAESLAVESSEVTPESRLVDDLGASSLDFIDIVFMLEKELDISVRSSEFSFLTKLDFSSPKVMKDGFLTRETIDRLREWLPALDRLPDPEKVTPRNLFSLITVETICVIAERRIEAKGQGA